MAIQQLQSAKIRTNFTHHLDKVSIYYRWEILFEGNYTKIALNAVRHENPQNQAKNKLESS